MPVTALPETQRLDNAGPTLGPSTQIQQLSSKHELFHGLTSIANELLRALSTAASRRKHETDTSFPPLMRTTEMGAKREAALKQSITCNGS